MEAIILPTFAILDEKAEMHLPTFTARNRAVAHRMFETAVLQDGHDFNKHPEDYSLWETGTFNQDTGVNTDISPHSNVVNAHHIIMKLRNSQYEDPRQLETAALSAATTDVIENIRKSFTQGG